MVGCFPEMCFCNFGSLFWPVHQHVHALRFDSVKYIQLFEVIFQWRIYMNILKGEEEEFLTSMVKKNNSNIRSVLKNIDSDYVKN